MILYFPFGGDILKTKVVIWQKILISSPRKGAFPVVSQLKDWFNVSGMARETDPSRRPSSSRDPWFPMMQIAFIYIPLFLKVRAWVSIVIKGTQNIDKIVKILIIQWMVLIGKRVVISIWDSFDLSFIDYLSTVPANTRKQILEQTLTHWLTKNES